MKPRGMYRRRLVAWGVVLAFPQDSTLTQAAYSDRPPQSVFVYPQANTGLAVERDVTSQNDATAVYQFAEKAMSRGDLKRAAAHFFQVCKYQRRVDLGANATADHPLLQAGDSSFLRVGRLKLRHDAEQIEHLLSLGRLAEVPYRKITIVYKNILPKLPVEHAAVDVKPGISPLFDRSFNRLLYDWQPDRIPTGRSVFGKDFDGTAVQRRFRDSELPPEHSGCEAQNGVTYVDDVFSEEVIETLKRWCDESSMWFASRGGYLAAFLQDAFNSPLIVQVAEELRRAFPEVLGPHQLMNMWGFKYANNGSDFPIQGTAVHADVAAVNINIWITDDSANEDADGGGLLIYTKGAPKEWSFSDYNSLDQVPRIREYLKDSVRVVIPHKRNRLVMFNSNFFHETQVPRFKPGYKNRRINLTFLFGRRCGGSAGTNEAYHDDSTAASVDKVVGRRGARRKARRRAASQRSEL
eukprot:TRINITY_DN18110_c0_g1_i1.p1 TRINITY_DN18110_c0_g1~~TRINITY_DN18110_c0_g1_i1.p1  ORF type:complete len:466 (+),score=54.72 TRINITY_DN18110_c0_g1_i1:90-1487(+)